MSNIRAEIIDGNFNPIATRQSCPTGVECLREPAPDRGFLGGHHLQIEVSSGARAISAGKGAEPETMPKAGPLLAPYCQCEFFGLVSHRHDNDPLFWLSIQGT
jgi:hypothetical protein